MTPTPEPPRRPRPVIALTWLSRLALGLVVAVWAVLIVAWGTLQFWIVPRAEAWRPTLESVATRALGVRVTVGAIEATAGGAIPALTLRDVRLLDGEGREALHLPRVLAALSVASLLRLGFDQLVIEAPTLEVRRLADGRWQVAGLDISPRDGDDRAADWFFSQREFALRGGTLRWIDETRQAAAPLTLTAVDLVVRNPGLRHEFRLDATPPADWGERLSVRGRFSRPFWQPHAGRWRDWSGELYLDAPRLDVQRLGQYADTAAWWGVRDLRGVGALRLWADVHRAHWQAATAEVQWRDVHLAWAPGTVVVEPLDVAHLGGRLAVQRRGDTTVWSTEGLTITTADGSGWPRGDVRFETTLAPDGALRGWALTSDRLDLAVLQRLARVLPLGEAVNRWAASTQPVGVAEALTLRWTAPATPEATARWEARGRVRGLGLQPGEPPASAPGQKIAFGRPGLEGVDADFSLDERGGRATLAVRNGSLTFPGVFEEPQLRFDELTTDARWTVAGPDIAVELTRLSFANADAAGAGTVRWRSADPQRSASRSRWPGILDLDVRLSRAEGTRVARYLPVTVGPAARRYLQTAIGAGRATSASFRVSGDLWDFPFATPEQGTFEVRAQLQDVALDYAPRHLLPEDGTPWPVLERVAGELLIERRRLAIGRASGSVVGQPALRALQTEAVIPDYLAAEPQLQVQGLIRGPSDEALRFVSASPLRALTSGVLDAARATGNLDVALDLRIPLAHVDRTRVRGQVRFAGNDVQMRPDVPLLQAVRGALDFTEQGFEVAQATARALGGDLRFSGGMARRDGAAVVRFQGQGTLTAAGLAASREWAWARSLGQRAQGSTRYSLGLAFGPDGLDLQFDSDLRGLGLALPAPLAKPADAAWRLAATVRALPRPDPGGDRTRDRLRLSLDPGGGGLPLQAEYEREHGPAGTGVLRGRLALGADLADWPAAGVAAVVRAPALDADAWQAAFESVQEGAAPRTAAALDTRGSEPYWPTRLGLSVDRLQLGGRGFDALTAGGTRDGEAWRLSVAARQFSGYLEYRPGADERLLARLARLQLPPSAAEDVERLAAQPRSVPALDIVVEDLELAGRPLGRLEVQATNRDAAGGTGVREWRLQALRLTVPEARLSATGNWAPMAALTTPGRAAAGRRTALQVRLDIDDAGALLERFGFAGTLRGGRGHLEGTVGWLGSPLSLHTPSLSGELLLDVQRGQFLKADPGIAKLLGVLSLQSLPRRLTLDFRDVFSEGFAFDFVRGNARIVRGVASTNNLQMKGVSAAVLIEGQADLVRETQDLTAVVVPELNAGTASLVATMINPVTGLGTFLAQWLLREPLQAAATQTFRVTGSWSDPQVERIRRTIGASDSTDVNPDRKP